MQIERSPMVKKCFVGEAKKSYWKMQMSRQRI